MVAEDTVEARVLAIQERKQLLVEQASVSAPRRARILLAVGLTSACTHIGFLWSAQDRDREAKERGKAE